MQGLRFFTKTNSPGALNIVSWHSPHSLTWRWFLSLRRMPRAQRKGPWFRKRPKGTRWQVAWVVRIPLFGTLSLFTQEPMWYRDMWRRRSLDEDRA